MPNSFNKDTQLLNSTTQKIQAQVNFCATKALPLFTPSNGICFFCGKQIYDAMTLETASSALVTGCPYCHVSFCE